MDSALPAQRLGDLIARLSPRAGPLIVTVFGDAVAPRGGNIWLGSLIDLMAPLGLSERLVRTGVYRLARDGWVRSKTRGRRSYYEITPSAKAAFAEAERRIYAAAPDPWDGEWVMVQMLPGLAASRRQALRSSLKWLGFGQLSPTLLVHPGGEDGLIAKAIADAHAAGAVSVFSARLSGLTSAADARATARCAWDFSHLNQAYETLIAAFRDFASAPPAGELEGFMLRILLVHEYRRVLLKDPQLPADLLPAGWAGAAARGLVCGLYRAVEKPADRFLAARFEGWEGSSPEPAGEYRNRFKSEGKKASAA